MKVCKKRDTKTTYGDLEPGDVFGLRAGDNELRMLISGADGGEHVWLTGAQSGVSFTPLNPSTPVIHYPNACVCLEGCGGEG